MGWIRGAWDDPCPWVYTHGCVMPPLRGSCGCFRFPWVPCTMCTSPTAVLCHRHAVLCYVTATRFCVMSPPCGSVLCHRYSVLLACVTSSVGFAAPKALALPTSIFLRRHVALRCPIGHVGNEHVTSASIQSQALRRRTSAERPAVPTSTRLPAMCCSKPCGRRCRLYGI